MRAFDRTSLLFCVTLLGLQDFVVGASADDKPGAQAPPGYATPQEAFEARRDALARRDWRKAFASLTPEVQDEEIIGLALGWFWVKEGMEGGPFFGVGKGEEKKGKTRLRATMTKYGLGDERLWAEYDKRTSRCTAWIRRRSRRN